MKKIITITILAITVYSCYDTEDDMTELRQFNLSGLQLKDSVIADGFSLYSFLVELPGVRYGNPKEVKFSTNWGNWIGGTDSITIPIKYNKKTDSYIDTVFLKAGRETGLFAINVVEKSKKFGSFDFEAFAQFPTLVQIISDSLQLKLKPGSTTKLKILFSSEKGFPSNDIRFRLGTLDSVNIFPKDIFIDSTEATATLQLNNESNIGDVQVFGEFPELEESQNFEIDTLKIKIIN